MNQVTRGSLKACATAPQQLPLATNEVPGPRVIQRDYGSLEERTAVRITACVMEHLDILAHQAAISEQEA